MNLVTNRANLTCKFQKRRLRTLSYYVRRVAYLVALLAVVTATASSRIAFAETPKSEVMDALASAEEAYQRVDFDTVYREATRGIEIGGANVKSTARLHSLVGISAAALGKDEDARNHFVVALALMPGLNLERGLSPRIRGPYMEAKGFWEAYPDRIKLETLIDLVKSSLSFALEDPAHIAVKVRIYLRKIGSEEYEIKEANATHAGAIVLPPEYRDVRFEFFSQLLDRFGNVVFEAGTASVPRRIRPSIEPRRSARATQDSPPKNEIVGGRTQKNGWPVILSATGIVSLGAGAVFNYRRETLANEWNSAKCEKPGATRLAQCGKINSERKVTERGTIGLYSAGGLLIISGIVTYILEHRGYVNKEKAYGQRHIVDCDWQFGGVFGASCVGTF
jgi:hypothetical protein